MTDGGDDHATTAGDGNDEGSAGSGSSRSHRATREEVAAIRRDVEAIKEDLETRTVPRSEVESDLRRYVRRRLRRGHARGWGPYLVLLYGTVMTLGAFYYLGGVWAVAAMLVIWLSTLGLYVFMAVVGTVLGVGSAPGRLIETIRDWRS